MPDASWYLCDGVCAGAEIMRGVLAMSIKIMSTSSTIAKL